jgi:hypothetical protein
MPLPDVKQVLLRAAVDSKFRTTLLREPDSALAEYNLTQEERQSLQGLTEDRIAEAVNSSDSSLLSLNDIRI